MQITPKLLTLVKIFDSLNHSFNFYWQNNDSKNIHSKKNLIIHSSKIFIQKKKNYSFKKKFIQKKNWVFIQKKYSFKSFFDYSFNENIHFFEKCRTSHPYPPRKVSVPGVFETFPYLNYWARSHQAWRRWRGEWRGSWNCMIVTSLIIKVHATEASDREQKNETFYK